MAEFKLIDEAVFQTTASNVTGPRAISARFDRRRRKLLLRLETGVEVAFDPRRVPGLEAATDHDLTDVEIEGVGSTLRVPRLDRDYGVARLLDLFLNPNPAASRDGDGLRTRRRSGAAGKSAA